MLLCEIRNCSELFWNQGLIKSLSAVHGRVAQDSFLLNMRIEGLGWLEFGPSRAIPIMLHAAHSHKPA